MYFPGVVISVNTSTSCHLSYGPLGKSAPLFTLHYILLHCNPTTYPTEQLAFHACTGPVATPSLLIPGEPEVIKNENSTSSLLALPTMLLPPVPTSVPPQFVVPGDLSTFLSHIPKCTPQVPPKTFLADDLASIPKHLQLLLDKLSRVSIDKSI